MCPLLRLPSRVEGGGANTTGIPNTQMRASLIGCKLCLMIVKFTLLSAQLMDTASSLVAVMELEPNVSFGYDILIMTL